MKNIFCGFLTILIGLQPALNCSAAESFYVASWEFHIPNRLGFISESYRPDSKQNTSSPDFIIIQDLHVHRTVQRAISKILKSLKDQRLLPDSIAVEGQTGFVALQAMQQYPDATLRREACDYLLSQGEMPGPFHFLVTEGEGSAFGMEDKKLYDATIALYQDSYAERAAAIAHLEQFQQGLNYLSKDPVLAWRIEPLQSKSIKLRALLRGEIVPELLAGTIRDSADLITTAPLIFPNNEDIDLVKPAAAMADFYAIAHLRDSALLQHAIELRRNQRQRISVLVVGGFHTPGLTSGLRALGFSYAVVTPSFAGQTLIDQNMYLARMLGSHVSEADAEAANDTTSNFVAQPRYDPVLMGRLFMNWVIGASQRTTVVQDMFLPVSLHLFANRIFVDMPSNFQFLSIFTPAVFDPFAVSWQAGVFMAAFMVTLISIVAWAVTRPTAEQKDFKRGNWRLWVQTKFPQDADAVLAKYVAEEIHVAYYDPQLRKTAEKIGLPNFMMLFHALSPFHADPKQDFPGQQIEFSMLIDKGFTALRNRHYDLSDPAVVLNKNLLIKAANSEIAPETPRPGPDEPAEVRDEWFDVRPNNNYWRDLIRRIEASSDLSGDAEPEPSIFLQIQDHYGMIKQEEWKLFNTLRALYDRKSSEDQRHIARLRDRLHQYFPDHIPDSGLDLPDSLRSAPYYDKVVKEMRSRQNLRKYDRELTELLKKLPPHLTAQTLLPSSRQRNRFPLRGSTDIDLLPEGENFYSSLRVPIETLLVYLTVEKAITSSGEDWAVIFGSDLEGVAMGAFSTARNADRIIISGGKGGYTPLGRKSEAEPFETIINAWGRTPTEPLPEMIIETNSDSTKTHAEETVRIILSHPSTAGKKKLKIAFVQAPAMQRRGLETLREEFRKHGVEANIRSSPPFFRDFDLVLPDIGLEPWKLAEWRQRLAHDVFREPAKMIEDRNLGNEKQDLVIPIKYLELALEVGKRLMDDPTIDAAEKTKFEGYRGTIEYEIRRLRTSGMANANGAHDAPLLMKLPFLLRLIIRIPIYPLEIFHELVHGLGFWLSGTPMERISFDWSLDHPRVWIEGEDLEDHPFGILTGILGSWGMVVAAGFASVFTLHFTLMLIGALVLAVMNSIPYVVKYRGQEIPSDMRLFVDGLRKKLQDPTLFTAPGKINYDLYNVWDNWFQPAVRAQVIAMRAQILNGAQIAPDVSIPADVPQASHPPTPLLLQPASRFLGSQA